MLSLNGILWLVDIYAIIVDVPWASSTILIIVVVVNVIVDLK